MIAKPETAKTEIRLNQKGKLSVYFDGVLVPGVINIEIDNAPRERAIVRITLIGLAVRLSTEAAEALDDDKSG